MPASVLVLGAGVAGLVAARELEAAGLRVRVLEATERVGGRVLTNRDLAGGAPAELGGELLEAGHEDLFRLLKEVGLAPVRVLSRGFRHWGPRGEEDMRWEALLAPLEDERPAFDRANRAWSSAAAARLGAVSLERWMRARRLPARDRERWRGLVRGLFFGTPRRFSLLQLLDELTGEQEQGPAGTFYRVRGGNDLLPRALAAGLARPVLRRAVVRRVEHGAHGVTVRAHVRGRLQHISADAAVVALPVPPLRAVEFAPALPEDQRRALRRVGVGGATKTVLHVASLRAPRGFAYGSALPVGAFWDAGEGVPRKPALVSVLAGGDLSAPHARRTERARVAWTARHLPVVGRVLAGRSACWERSPYAGGGYATFDVGFAPALRDALRRPFSRLAFAGEHTSRSYQGYLNGAVESGRRAAEEVLALLARVAE